MSTRLNNLKQDLVEFAESSPMREVCGFICREGEELVLKKVRNTANNHDLFMIHPVDFLERKLSGDLVAIFHTHVDCDEKFSEFDVENSKSCLYPFVIYSLESQKFNLFDMEHFERDENSVIYLKGILDD